MCSPFSGQLLVDQELALSCGDIYLSIKNKIERTNTFKPRENLSPVDKLRFDAKTPTPYAFAKFSSDAYLDERGRDLPTGWQEFVAASSSSNGYYGVAYLHANSQQVVVSHRGTNSWKAVYEDYSRERDK